MDPSSLEHSALLNTHGPQASHPKPPPPVPPHIICLHMTANWHRYMNPLHLTIPNPKPPNLPHPLNPHAPSSPNARPHPPCSPQYPCLSSDTYTYLHPRERERERERREETVCARPCTRGDIFTPVRNSRMHSKSSTVHPPYPIPATVHPPASHLISLAIMGRASDR